MDVASIITNGAVKHVKVVLLATFTVPAFFLFASTDLGSRTLSQIGIKDSIAQTVVATQTTLQQTGDTLRSFLGRSPGERRATDLLKGKTKSASLRANKTLADAKPNQRALGKVFDQPTGAVADAVLPEALLQSPVAFAPASTASAVAPIAALAPIASIGPAIFSPIIGGGGIGGGGGGGGGGSIVVPPPVPPVTSAVPEPSTWLLLLVGFGAIGASLRRTNAEGSLLLKRARNCTRN